MSGDAGTPGPAYAAQRRWIGELKFHPRDPREG